MWASRPSLHHDNDMPIDLTCKKVNQRVEEHQISPSRRTPDKWNKVRDPPGRWNTPPVALPLGNLRPFMSEKYGVRCSLVSDDEKGGGRGTILETAIRKLHHNRQKAAEPPKDERCRSTDIALERSEKDLSFDGKRSSSCPDLTVIKPKPSPIKPKSSFIQRSSGYISDNASEPNNLSVTCTTFHHDPDEHSNSQPKCGAKKRKSFIPVYGDRVRPLTPEEEYFPHHDKRRPWSLVKNNEYFSQGPRSPFEREEYYSHSEKRPRSPEEEYYSHHHHQESPVEPEEYFSHPEVLLRRQLQQHSPSPYLVHVYDYYQQLVQRMREHSSPGMRLPPPVSPPSGDDESQLDGQRKRPCRALTGKHVRQGTGASISTLLTLRQKIQERQKAKEHEPRTGLIGNSNRNGSPKKNKANQKIKNKTMQIQKC